MNDNITKKHDPMLNIEDGEGSFPLVGRDRTSPGTIRYWAAWRAKDINLMDAIHENNKKLAMKIPFKSDDGEHVIAAREIATRMELWYRENRIPVKLPDNDVRERPMTRAEQAALEAGSECHICSNPDATSVPCGHHLCPRKSRTLRPENLDEFN